MNWKRFTILIVSAVIVTTAVKFVMACAWEPDPYEAPSFFLNTINKQPAFVPFYYTPDLVFYTDGYGFEQMGFDDRIPDPNIPTWRKYTHNEVPEADIDSFVYRFNESDVRNIYNSIQKKYSLDVPRKVAQNGFTKWLLKKKDAQAAFYLDYAKRCEPYTVPLDANWDDISSRYVSPKRDSAAMQELVHEGIKLYNAATNDDIRLRYAYQTMRMAFYSREYPQTLMLFNTLITSRPDNFIYYRCLSLKAGALYKTGRNSEAAYLYSLAFDKSDEIKKSTYTSFRWAVNGRIDTVLGLCKNDHERAVLYIMQGLYNYEDKPEFMFNALKKAYDLDPKVRGLDIVMTRCINRLEKDVIPGIASGKNSNESLSSKLDAFARRAAADGRIDEKAYWRLCSAYICLLENDMKGCKQFLDIAAAGKMTPPQRDVHFIISTLYIARKDGRITEQTENELLPSLKTLQQRSAKEKRYSSLLSDIMVMVLKDCYLQQGDSVKAIYCYSKSYDVTGVNKYAGGKEDFANEAGVMLERMSPERIKVVEAFITKTDKTPFEQWLTDHTRYTADALYELEGTKYIRTYNFADAIPLLKKVSARELDKTPLPDVLVSHIKDSQEWNASDKTATYNKLTFAQKMYELQQALAKNPADARAAYQYANGLYSMSYYGKGHHAFDYYRTGTSEYAYFDYMSRKALTDFELSYYNVRLPEKYYMQAFDHYTDPEMKARCLYMAAKCRQKNCPPRQDQEYYAPDQGTYYLYSIQSPYFTRLKKEYGNTAFYSNAVNTCSYLKDFASINK